MSTSNEIRQQHGAVDQRIVIGIVTVAVVGLAALWLFTFKPEPEPVPAPGPTLDTVEPAETAAERGDSGREIISELSSAEGGVDYARAHERAQAYQAEGRMADAQLLYFFAARGGNAAAAFDLATFYDPNHHSQTPSLMEEPDPFQAYRWYRAAEEAGHQDASERLADLRAWAEQAADGGDVEAERLLLQWE
jgi:TPR repeat protein